MSGRADLTTRAWKAQTERVKARDGYRCVSCGREDDLTVDHIEPVAKTRRTDYADHELVTLCRSCNSSKGDRTLVRITYRNPKWL